tara:strand:- start:419 stop:1516 length:1098 start_codon:yes stop_codon:yes gene_type:complete
MNQQINEEQNTIDRGVSDITSFDLLEQPDTNLNKSAFKTELDESYRIEDEVEESDPRFFQSAIPGVLTALTTDNLSAINLLNPLSSSEDKGPIDYFSSVFAKSREGEMFISAEDINSNPNIKEWMENTSKIMKDNAQQQILDFSKSKNLMDDATFQEYYNNAFDKDPNMELEETKFLYKTVNQFYKPQPYKSGPDGGIIINRNTLPEIPMEADSKFTKEGDLSLTYAGLYGYNDEGEFVMKRPSMFRFTDEFTRGKENDGILSNFVEKAEDYFYPKMNAALSYGDSPDQTAGYMVGQFAPGIRGLTGLAKYGGKKLLQSGKGIMNLIRGNKGTPDINLSKIDPYIKSNMDQGLGSIETKVDLFNR